MPGRTEQGCDDRRHHAGVEAVFGWHAGNCGESDTLRQHDGGASEPGKGVGAQAAARHVSAPAQERQESL